MQHNQIFLRLRLFSLLLIMLFSSSVWALSCKKDESEVSQIITLSEVINVSTAKIAPGVLLWRSPTFTSTFTCTDVNDYPEGEDAYFHWDPTGKVQIINDSIEVGVIYGGKEIKPIKGSQTLIAPGTVCNMVNGECQSPAKPQMITVSYSIYIKSTGKKPPDSGKIEDNNIYALFQIDGVGGLNETPNANFRALITGLGNIRFIACKPEIKVSANNGSTVDFGKITLKNLKVGEIARQIPFIIRADLTGDGQDCQGQTLLANFSTPNVKKDDIISPEEDSGFGIFISSKDSPNNPLKFNSTTELGYVNGSVVENTFFANFKWLSPTPKIGPFNVSANVDITFK